MPTQCSSLHKRLTLYCNTSICIPNVSAFLYSIGIRPYATINKCLIKAYKKLLQHGQEIWIEIISLLLATALVVLLREEYMLTFGLTSICLQKLKG